MLKDFMRYFWEKIVLPACGFFTLFLFLIALVSSFSDPDIQPAILLSQAMVILLFSFVFSALNRILFIRSLHPFIRVGIHFLSSTAALVLIMMCLSGFYAANGVGSTIFMTLFFVILYVIVLALLLLLQAFGIHLLHLPTEEKKSGKKIRMIFCRFYI